MLNDQITTADDQPILEVRNLKTYFYTDAGVVKAVDGVDFSLQRGEVLGLVGESGCGKSVTSFSIMRLVGQPGRIVEGEILFEGQDLVQIPEIRDDPHARQPHVDDLPAAAIQPEPVYKIGDQVAEVLRIHQQMTKDQAWAKAVELLRLVGIPDAEKKASAYPHEVSGGQAQRVMIAMALALNPQLLIADEPTTALDVTIQAQILDLMRNLRTSFETSVILITHDLGVIAEMADNVAVMYAGRIVEKTDVNTLFARPLHPYTQGLIDSIPVLGVVKERLEVIPGNVPNLVNLPPGCRFAPRCLAREQYGLEICNRVDPELEMVERDHTVRCWLYLDYEDHRAPLRLEQDYPVEGSIQLSGS